MSKETTEIQALGEIDSLFQVLDQDAQKRILDFISSKYKLPVNKVMGLSANANSGNFSREDNPDIHIKDFVASKRPESSYEKVTCVAYYLEKYKNMETFKTIDITKAFQEARLIKLSNPTLFVNDATWSYGYLTPSGTGSKTLTPRGEALVVALPDRDKVTQALADYPFKRSKRKK